MDKIEKIRQEIERRKLLLAQHRRLAYSLILETFIKEYDDLLSFLDTLSEEPDKSLEEEVKNYFQGHWPGTETAEQCNTDLHFTPPAILRFAHHFAQWGAEHAKKDETPVPNDLEKATKEEAEEWAENEAYGKPDAEFEMAYKGFIAGAKWQAEKCDEETSKLLYGERQTAYINGWDDHKEQMMKEAVEGRFVDLGSGYQAQFDSELLDTFNIKYGQKFKVIIIPEDEK